MSYLSRISRKLDARKINLANVSCISCYQIQQHRRISYFEKFFGVAPRAPEGTNRWFMFLPAFTTHVCLGAPYGWSAISLRLSLESGMVSPATSDWSLDQTTWPMGVMIASGGVSAAVLGSWTVRVGVRQAMATGGILFGGGLLLSSLGIAKHNLFMLYMGNIICGMGYGCAYTPPLQALIDWFPDKKGLASGLVIAGFGSGALAFTPAINLLAAKFCVHPTYLGAILPPNFALSGVVQCTAGDLAKLPYDSLAPGWYIANTGSTGIYQALAIMAIVYSSLIIASAFTIAKPCIGYVPANYSPQLTKSGSDLNVPVENVLSTPQFWLLFSTATLLATGGMSLMSVASPLVQEVFTRALPSLVTPAFASVYLMSLSVANLSGRIFWAAISDKIGTRNTFTILSLASIPLYLSIPSLISGCVSNPSSPFSIYYLAGFCTTSFLAVSIMGGVFSVLPPYEADLYGSKYVGAIHGKFLPFSTLRGIAGPAILLHLRNKEESKAIDEILVKVDPELFRETFGVNVCQVDVLLETKVLTLSKLVSLLPPGATDPSPFLYNSSMFTMAGLACFAGALHFIIKPVDRKYFEKTN